MKKRWMYWVAVALLLFLFSPGTVSVTASTEIDGGFQYTVENGNALVTFYSGSATEVTIPDTLGGYPVSSIVNAAFSYNKRLTSVIIPEGVTSIEDYTFNGCSSLISVTLPDGMLRIGAYAFQDCTALTNIALPDSVQYIGHAAFWKCQSLTSMAIPAGVRRMAGNLFNGCSNLTSVTIAEGVTEIEYAAFYGCCSLTGITLPGSLRTMGSGVFTGCTGLTSIRVGDGNTAFCDIDGVLFSKDRSRLMVYPIGKSDTVYTIPNDVTDIGDYAFEDCQFLTSVNVLEGVASIGVNAFYHCASLTSVTLPDSVMSIGYGAFCVCYSLESVTLPNRLTTINEEMLWGCGSLKSVVIPKSVTSIERRAFDGCSSLQEICYGGNANDREAIVTASGNSNLKNAVWHYNGCTSPQYTNACDATCDICGATRAITHTYETTTVKATLTQNGSIVKACAFCGKVASKTTVKYPKSFALSVTSYTYNGAVKTPIVSVKDSAGKTLQKGIHYSVTYASGRKNVGTYKVTIKMKGNYSGTKTLTFKIDPIKIDTCKLKLSTDTYTYNGAVKTPIVSVKNASGKTLQKGIHYSVTYASGRKNVGTYKVTIKMKGNYSGTKTLTFKIDPPKTAVSKLTAGKKAFTVAVTKKSGISGYQIEYSTSKSFKSATTKTITSTKYTLKNLKAATTYYVRVRTYKTVGGKKVYSDWSAAKSVKTKT